MSARGDDSSGQNGEMVRQIVAPFRWSIGPRRVVTRQAFEHLPSLRAARRSTGTMGICRV